jgi:hypothetical protein
MQQPEELPAMSPQLPQPMGEAALPQPSMPLQIGPYQIESFLNKGGMSTLYLGSLPSSYEPVIIKALSPQFLEQADIVERFLREAEIIATADHPNIVKMYSHGSWEGGFYIAMEFIQGLSLRQFILQNPISLQRGLEIILEIAYAVCHLHIHGIIHSDLKPENVLLNEEGKVKLIDFGIAFLLRHKEEDPSTPAFYRTVGTPIYMSPEQLAHPLEISYASDIYSLGIIAYEILLGRLSHGQLHLSLMPKGMQKILSKALQPKVEDRYRDIVEFISDVSNYLHSPTMHKDKKAGDRINELAEQLRSAQQLLLSPPPPQLTNLEVGSASVATREARGCYCDSFTFNSGYHLLLFGESTVPTIESALYSAMMRGAVRTLCQEKLSPDLLADKLNSIIAHDNTLPPFNLCCLAIDTPQRIALYLSCGYGELWHLPIGSSTAQRFAPQPIALGSADKTLYTLREIAYQPGDLLLLITYSILGEHLEDHPLETVEAIDLLSTAIPAFRDSSPTTQAQTLLRKLQLTGGPYPLRITVIKAL